jgi:hypothetical protein
MLLQFLAGLEDGLPAEPLITQAGVALAGADSDSARKGGAGPQDTEQSASRARLFEEIVTPQQEVKPRSAPQPPSSWLGRLPRWLLYALLIVAVALPLLLGDSFSASLPGIDLSQVSFLGGRTIPVSSPVIDLHDRIETLQSDAPVLLAVDYDPTGIEEMDVVGQVIVAHLMDRGARVVAVSLLPAGAASAQELLEKSAADQPRYHDGYDQRYANLGYLSGQTAAIRLLGQSVTMAFPRDFFGNPVANLEVMEGIDSLQDFDLVVELAANQDTLRWWLEQGSTPHDVPLGAGVSASVEPLARPYYETGSRQLVGLVSGVPGAAMYQTLREVGESVPEAGTDQGSGSQNVADHASQVVKGPLTRTFAARLDAQLMGFLILIATILVGNGVYFARRAAGKER